MSLFSKLFGMKDAAAPTTAEAINRSHEIEDMLIKKQDFLDRNGIGNRHCGKKWHQEQAR